jgi:acetyl esterase/lipase
VKTLGSLGFLLGSIVIHIYFVQLPEGEPRGNAVGAPVERHVYAVLEGDSLALDLRLPQTKPTFPVGVVFLHGGGFSAGHRSLGPHVDLLEVLASEGIASASISYRLTMKGRGFGCNIPSQDKQHAVESAVQDAETAFEWLSQSPLPLPEDWIIMGSSAGAEAAMWAGYGQGSTLFRGVVSFSGAIDASVHVSESAPPFFGVHGMCDDVVPSGNALHRRCNSDDPGAWPLCGGECWSSRMFESGAPHQFWGICGGDHSICNSAMTDAEIQDHLLAWIKSEFASSTRQYQSHSLSPFGERVECPSPCH